MDKNESGSYRRVFYGSALTGHNGLVEDLRPDASEQFWQAMIDSVKNHQWRTVGTTSQPFEIDYER